MLNKKSKIYQKYLEYRYKKAPPIYIIVQWAKWCVIKAQYSGHFNRAGEPVIIIYTDHNGLYDDYYYAPWNRISSGATAAYSFNLKHAEELAKILNEKGR